MPFPEFRRSGVPLVSAAVARQTSLPGSVSPEQDQLVWDLVERLYADYLNGSLTTPQLGFMVFTWRGTTGTFGWASVKDSLPPTVRGPFSYVMGHRYLRLNKRDQATAFFRTALSDAPQDSTLARLAQAELSRLEPK